MKRSLLKRFCVFMASEPAFTLVLIGVGVPLTKLFQVDFYYWLLLLILFKVGQLNNRGNK